MGFETRVEFVCRVRVGAIGGLVRGSFYLRGLESRVELSVKCESEERECYLWLTFMGGAGSLGVRGRGGLSVRTSRIVFGDEDGYSVGRRGSSLRMSRTDYKKWFD